METMANIPMLARVAWESPTPTVMSPARLNANINVMVPSRQHLQNYYQMGGARTFATFAGRPLDLVRMVLDGECRPECAERGWSWLVSPTLASRALNLVRVELVGSCRVLG